MVGVLRAVGFWDNVDRLENLRRAVFMALCGDDDYEFCRSAQQLMVFLITNYSSVQSWEYGTYRSAGTELQSSGVQHAGANYCVLRRLRYGAVLELSGAVAHVNLRSLSALDQRSTAFLTKRNCHHLNSASSTRWPSFNIGAAGISRSHQTLLSPSLQAHQKTMSQSLLPCTTS